LTTLELTYNKIFIDQFSHQIIIIETVYYTKFQGQHYSSQLSTQTEISVTDFAVAPNSLIVVYFDWVKQFKQGFLGKQQQQKTTVCSRRKTIKSFKIIFDELFKINY